MLKLLRRCDGKQTIDGKPFSDFLKDVGQAALGFGKEQVVYADQSGGYEQAVCILAALLSGKTIIPLCARYGQTRNNQIRAQVAATKIPKGVAAVLFTSGTSGAPKGVMLTGKALSNNIAAISRYMGAQRRRILIIRPLIHSAVFTGELLYAIRYGWDIYFWDKAFVPTSIAAYIAERRIEIVGMTPTLLKTFIRFGLQLPLKEVILSGERLSKEDAFLFAETYPLCQFYSVYGLTENGPRVSALCPKDFLTFAGSVGKPLKGVRIKIADGELLVKSNSIMSGYLGDVDGTKQKFACGWLKTGDRAKTDRAGNLYILGRKDGMIIRSGMNIYPEEIERPMLRLNGIEDCVAYGMTDRTVGTKIILEYTGEADERQAADFAVGHLPPYLVPDSYRKKAELKKTFSGKLRRDHDHECD